MSNYSSLTAPQLRQAANLKEKIADLQKQLDAILGGSAAKASVSEKPKRRKMSAAARAKIAAAQRARWAKVKAKK
jgi:hypothetical protein